MNLLCPIAINCPGTDNPFANLSSELPDAAYWKRMYFFDDNPPIGVTYSKIACAVVYNSDISQQDADEQAAIAALLCVVDTWEPPGGGGGGTGGGGGGGMTTYFNAPQSCSVPCPDGSLFTYTVGYGRYAGLTQAQANQAALSVACNLARQNKLCLSALPATICLNTTNTLTIMATASLNGGTLLWQVVAGSIPTGMTFNGGYLASTQVTITGTPTTTGTYHFSVSCVASNGDYMVRAYTLVVAGITNTLPLADGIAGTAYTPVQLTTSGFTSPVFIVGAGALPDGMNLTSAGLLDGTPTVPGTYDFTIQIDGI